MIFDEASNIADLVWEVAEGALTDEDTEIIWVAFGNPTRNTGRFRECFRKYKHRWKTAQIDSRTVEGTNKQQLQKWVDDYGEDSDFVKIRVRGIFPDASELQFIPTGLTDEAMKRVVTAAQVAHAPVIIGVDPAYSGVDDAVIYLRQGLHSKVLWTGNKTTDDLIMAKRIADFEDQYQADAVFIDFGYGTGLKSIGDGWGRTWQLVPFGGASTDPQMLNKRGEMFNSCKTWLRLGGMLDDQETADDLSTAEYKVRVDGKIVIEPKEDIKERLGRSPGNAAFDAASPEAQASFMRQADQLRRQQQAEYKTMIDSQVRDATAAYMRGVEFPNPPGEADFIAAYGVREGNLRYTEFRNTQIAGQYIGSFRNMPTSSITAYVEQLRPDTGETGEGYAARAALYDNVVSAASQVIKQRQADPVQFSLAAGQAKPIDMSNKDNFGQSVALRAAQVSDLAKSYGTPLTFFSKDEANQIGVFFRDAPVSQQAAYLDTIRQSTGGGQVYMSALQQISANAPSAAVAGILMDKPGGILAEKNWFNPDVSVSPETAAQTILAGAAARKGTDDAKGIPMPKDADLRLEFSDMVKNAFAGDAQGASMAYEIAKDYYAGVMAKKGVVSGEIDNDIWKQAVNVATGGVHDYNGMGNVLLPWGMSAEQFDKQVNQAWNEQVVGTGIKTPPGQYGLQSYGDSQYLVKLGTGYLLKDDGSPVVLDLTQKRQRFSGDIPQ